MSIPARMARVFHPLTGKALDGIARITLHADADGNWLADVTLDGQSAPTTYALRYASLEEERQLIVLDPLPVQGAASDGLRRGPGRPRKRVADAQANRGAGTATIATDAHSVSVCVSASGVKA